MKGKKKKTIQVFVSASFQLAPGGYPIKQALPKLFVFSLRKYTQAANDTATYNYNYKNQIS